MSEEQKKIEVVSGNGNDLDISPVYEHLTSIKPKLKNKDKKNIIIPEVKKNNKSKEEKESN